MTQQPTYTSQLAIRVTAEQRAELDALMARWQLSQAATITRAVRLALELNEVRAEQGAYSADLDHKKKKA